MVWSWGDCVTRLRLAREEKRMFGSDDITQNWWRLDDSMAAGNDDAVVLIWSLRSKAGPVKALSIWVSLAESGQI